MTANNIFRPVHFDCMSQCWFELCQCQWAGPKSFHVLFGPVNFGECLPSTTGRLRREVAGQRGVFITVLKCCAIMESLSCQCVPRDHVDEPESEEASMKCDSHGAKS
jgi:hypothetical protein